MSIFKIYGYQKGSATSNEISELHEITIQAEPEVLRTISAMLLKSADELEESNVTDWDHIHLQDEWENWNTDHPDIIVVNPNL